MKPVDFDFKSFKRDNKQNSYLVCPTHFCHTRIDQLSPEFNVDVNKLQQAWNRVITTQPRTTLIYENNSHRFYQYVQRSLVFRFPDYINVQFIPMSSNKSTLAIYSHAVYGYSDFGVNKKRITSWLAQLQTSLAQ